MSRVLSLVLILLSSISYAHQAHNEPINPIPAVPELPADIVQLGERLFHETRLSIDGSVSCASCHNLAAGGVDGKIVSTGVSGQKGDMNAPTVFNSALMFRQFWDGRALTLFDQVDGPIHNPKEMASNWNHVLTFLSNDEAYKKAFEQAYEDGVQKDNVKHAIITFEKTLLTPNSRFDKYLQGDEQALNDEEKQGYNLFKGYGCVSCHQGVAVGGNMFQKLGVMKAYFTDGNYTQADLGLYNRTGLERDKHVFKVPSLRNVALTKPYLHNGKAETLNEAVTIMMNYQLGVTPPEQDIASIVTFLQTLTGEYKGDQL